jgi:signal transduction histidine kinase
MDVLDVTVDRALQRRALVRNARRYKLDLERRNNELRESKAKLQRLQTEIVKNEKMASLGVLAAGVAHELNNPAGFIIGNLEILKRSAGGFARLLRFYEELSLSPIEASALKQLKDEIDYENTFAELGLMITDCCDGAERIRDVVQNLQTFSRQDHADYKKIDIHEGIESTIHFLSRYYSSGSINLYRNYADLPLVDCFAGQLNQVWMNLLANAADAVETGGDVFISTSQLDGKVIVKISDTGCGMQPEHISRIFDPFFTTKSVGKGTGLGLSVSYSIIERHSGAIEVESTPGQGTTFKVILPIDAVQSLNEHDEHLNGFEKGVVNSVL